MEAKAIARKSAWPFIQHTNDPRLSTQRKFASAVGVKVSALLEEQQMRLPRLQIGLRLMLLLVALVAVWVAYFGAMRSNRQQVDFSQRFSLNQRIESLKERRTAMIDAMDSDPRLKNEYDIDVSRIDAEVATLKSQLDALNQ